MDFIVVIIIAFIRMLIREVIIKGRGSQPRAENITQTGAGLIISGRTVGGHTPALATI